MSQFSFWLGAILFTGLITIALGITAYWLIGLLRTINERVELSLKIMGHNLKTLKYYGRGLNELKLDSKKIISSQSKAFDYQNVLINSLNRQLRNLDAILSDGKQLAQSGSKPAFVQNKNIGQNSTQAKNSRLLSPVKFQNSNLQKQEEITRPDPVTNNSVILLDQLLAVKRGAAGNRPKGSEKIAKLSSIFEQSNSGYFSDQNMTERKVSNG